VDDLLNMRRLCCVSLACTRSLTSLRKLGRLYTLELVPRDGLQDAPGVMGEFQKVRDQAASILRQPVIPRPAQIQGKLGQVIESSLRGKKKCILVADTCLLLTVSPSDLFWMETLLAAPPRIADNCLCFLQDPAQMFLSTETLRIDLVYILSP